VSYCSVITAARQTQALDLFSSHGTQMGVILPQLYGLYESVEQKLNFPSNLVMAFT
jgi:hypothetical protein